MKLKRLICGLVAVNLALAVAWAAETPPDYVVAMNVAWSAAQQSATVHTVRGNMTQARDDLARYKAAIDAEIAKGQFDTVDAAIKTEALAVRTIINAAVTALNNHSEFLDWKQPEN